MFYQNVNEQKIVTPLRRLWYFALILFFVALFARLLVFGGLIAYDGPVKGFVFGDGTRYFGLAESVVEGRGYVYEDGIESYRPPGYPAYLMPFIFLGLPVWFAVFVQLLIASCIPVAVLFVATRSFHLPLWVGMVAGLFAALEPVQVFYSVTLTPDVFFTVGLFLSLYFLVRYVETGWWMNMVFAGLALGCANYMRPAGIYAAFVLIASLWVFLFIKNLFSKKSIIHGMLFVAVSVLTIVPWCIRNYYTFDSFSFVSSSAYTFFAYGGVATQAVADNRDYNVVKKEFLNELAQKAPDPLRPTSLRNKSYLVDKTINVIKQHPVAYIKTYLLGVNTLFFSGNYHYLLSRYKLIDRPDGLVSFSLVFASEGFFGLLKAISRLIFEPYVLLAVAGKIMWMGLVLCSVVGAIVMRRHPLAILFLASMFYFAVTILATTIGVEARHRYALNPLIFLFVSVVFYLLYEKGIRRRAGL